jgi:molybdate transport system regulatory protein
MTYGKFFFLKNMKITENNQNQPIWLLVQKGGVMPSPDHHFHMRSKIWIEDDQGHVVFGLGRYRILDQVRQTGSLYAAAKSLKMSYRAVWMRIRTSEERLGQKLVVREGNGSRLTPFGESLMATFDRLHERVIQETDTLYQGLVADNLGGSPSKKN